MELEKDYVQVASAKSAQDAAFLVMLLQDAGVQAEARGENLSALVGYVPDTQRVFVPRTQKAQAESILAEREARTEYSADTESEYGGEPENMGDRTQTEMPDLAREPRTWFQISLSKAFVLMLIAAVFVFKNVSSFRGPEHSKNLEYVYGWPLKTYYKMRPEFADLFPTIFVNAVMGPGEFPAIQAYSAIVLATLPKLPSVSVPAVRRTPIQLPSEA
jgi:hypothetical protein